MPGIKLNISKTGEVTGFKKGKVKKPHRNDYIAMKLRNRDFEGLDEIFFEQPVPGYDNESDQQQMIKEGELMSEYIELLKDT